VGNPILDASAKNFPPHLTLETLAGLDDWTMFQFSKLTKIFKIEVLNHIIVGNPNHSSFRLLHQAAELARDMAVVGRDLVGDPQGHEPRAPALQRPCVRVRAITHLSGGGQNAVPRIRRHLRIAGQRQAHELAGQTKFPGDFLLCNHAQ
jgi:hypothetical protein